jgi:hypothetical protein
MTDEILIDLGEVSERTMGAPGGDSETEENKKP